jgi:predicted DNA-binding protein (MmcQ/YjbR family)
MSTELRDAVRAFAASLPEAWEDHPWGESVYKVGKRVFVFFGVLESDPGLRSPSSCASRMKMRWHSNGWFHPATAWSAAGG